MSAGDTLMFCAPRSPSARALVVGMATVLPERDGNAVLDAAMLAALRGHGDVALEGLRPMGRAAIHAARLAPREDRGRLVSEARLYLRAARALDRASLVGGVRV